MMKTGQHPFLLIRTLMLALLGLSLFMSTSARAIDPTEVQLDKLSPEQLEQAAEAGDPDAQYALGYMYYYGNGVPQDRQKAGNWIKRASVQGQEQATKALALIGPADTSTQTTSPTVKPESTVARTTNAPQTATQGATSAGMAPSDSLLAEEQHILSLPSDYYTVQVLGSYNEKEVAEFIHKYNLKGKAAYYRGDNKGKDWYVVLYGFYPTSAEAKAAIPTLPEGVQKQKPWVKPLMSVQEGIKKKQA